MVESVEDCFSADGQPLNYRVGAMCWRHHDQPNPELDTDPRPLPHLAVMTPAGLVCLDCPADGDRDRPGRYWVRDGEPPVVTVTPSLNVRHGMWHGWLTEGELREA